MNTSNLIKNEQSNNEKTDREQVSHEYHSLERDHRGNVLVTKEALEVCHEATRFEVFLDAISHHKFIQDRGTYKALHKENAKYIPHLDDITRPQGITAEAEDKFGWCPEVMAAAARWAKYRKSIQKNKSNSAMKKVVNTKNKTGPGRSPFERHLSLIRTMLDSGAALWEVTDALSKLGEKRAPNSLSEWLKRRKQGYRHPSFGYLAPLSPSPISRSPQIKTLIPPTVSFSLHTTSNAPASVPQSPSQYQISPTDLAALKAKAKKSAEELSDRIPQ